MTQTTPDNSPPPPAGADPDWRRMMKWVFVALVLSVLLAVLAVELTMRWFGGS
jgi:hypothetical protein